MADKREWDDRHRMWVRLIYGMLIGTVLIVGAFHSVLPHLFEGGLDKTEMAFIGGLVVLGLVAALPHTFKEFVGEVVARVRRNGS